MDLTTNYMGLKLNSPLVPSASPLTRDVAEIKRAEDAGASAVVLPSVFEEQLRLESAELDIALEQGAESFAEATSYFPSVGEFRLGPEDYLDHIQKAKAAVGIPVIASLNGTSVGGWTDYARQIEAAGADGLELNIYYIPTDPELTSPQVEQTYLDILKAVKGTVKIPVAVKLSPFFSSLANMARRLDAAGADALVLFNRFYQPDIDLDNLEVEHSILLSTPQARRLPLRWIAILHGRIQASLAATSGIHTAADALKVIMAGADVAMLCSVLLRKGVAQIAVIEREMRRWLEEHEYDSLEQARGSLSQKSVANPAAFERAQYMRVLSTYELA
ncbi:MAG: dihydroorotate dehydrogenase-like protein [Verrucomicrobiales bacterium]|nr:dihydroorotate dehydrogenase-like protein [Verrucomicrobiales bacterium]